MDVKSLDNESVVKIENVNENTNENMDDEEIIPTKLRILNSALDLFCTRGYSETSIRDIATAAGITSGSIYGHFSSKDELLQYMLNDYSEYTNNMFFDIDVMTILRNNPTGAGVTACIMESISLLVKNPYYANIMHLIHQEQHRNEYFGAFLLKRARETVEYVEGIVNALIEIGAIRPDAKGKHWGTAIFSLLHTVATCIEISRALKIPGYGVAEIADVTKLKPYLIR